MVRRRAKDGGAPWATQVAGVLALAAVLGAQSCQSAPSVSSGVQSKYAAINPTRILAVTPIAISVPRLAGSVIDPTILRTLPVTEWIESGVLRAFAGQPAVNGVSFQAVRRALQHANSQASPLMLSALESTVAALQRPGAENQGVISPECFGRKDFFDFYSLCLKRHPSWKKGLNELSATVLNADAALFVFVTQLQSQSTSSENHPLVQLQVVLVDTNNAELIWRGSAQTDGPPVAHEPTAAESPGGGTPAAKPADLWRTAVESLFDEALWAGFPGRLPKGTSQGST
jgi:hypothetical protein